MKKLDVLYSCNVTVHPSKYDLQVKNIIKALKEILHNLDRLEIKAAFFIDAVLFLQMKKKSPAVYHESKTIFKKIRTRGHSVNFLINPIWETSKNLHYLDKEYLLDLFAQGKHIVQEITADNSKEKTIAVRVLNGEIQPFAYLQEIYQMCGVKVDASIFPKIKTNSYFDFSNIKYGETIRFSNDPNNPERFGKYLGLPRGMFKLNFRLHASMKRELNHLNKTDNEEFEKFLDASREVPMPINIPVSNQRNEKILSPDVIPPEAFKKILEKQKSAALHICVLESSLEDLTALTVTNLTFIKNNYHYRFVSLVEIVNKYATSYRNHIQTK